MSERPIIFSGPMVRAILDGRKTQTRRVVKPQPFAGVHSPKSAPRQFWNGEGDGRPWWTWMKGEGSYAFAVGDRRCPYGMPGDRLWVREAWQPATKGALPQPGVRLLYRADDIAGHVDGGWRPSIHMPRWASRLTLEVVDVRVQRVQEISEEDAIAEGCAPEPTWTTEPPAALDVFEALWDSINGKRGFGWNINPWVWAITFRRVEAQESAA